MHNFYHIKFSYRSLLIIPEVLSANLRRLLSGCRRLRIGLLAFFALSNQLLQAVVDKLNAILHLLWLYSDRFVEFVQFAANAHADSATNLDDQVAVAIHSLLLESVFSDQRLLQLALEGLQKHFQVREFFHAAEVARLLEDLVEGQHFEPLLGLGLGKLELAHEVCREPVLLLVRLSLFVDFLLRRVVASVDDQAVFANNALLGSIIQIDGFKINVEAHELGEGLLAHDSLRHQVALADGFIWKTARSKPRMCCQTGASLLFHFFPAADPELHQGQLEDFHFFGVPSRSQCVVPQGTRLPNILPHCFHSTNFHYKI